MPQSVRARLRLPFEQSEPTHRLPTPDEAQEPFWLQALDPVAPLIPPAVVGAGGLGALVNLRNYYNMLRIARGVVPIAAEELELAVPLLHE